MPFADLKNDFVFRRIFATHPDILRALLNDLLDRHGERTIESIEYLPSEQLPIVDGAKLSILDVRCKERAGATFIVEMQLLHHAGFMNRVVYNACKAYVSQLKEGDWYTKLANVVAISICNFELWPDDKQHEQGLPLVPMLSRWSVREEKTANHGFLQVQYAFLELPKVRKERPATPGADLWAWMFVHGTELDEMPPDLPVGPHRDALELANRAKFTQAEMEAYERVRDEIRQVIEIAAERKAEGRAEGRAEGEISARRNTLLRILERAGIALAEGDQARIQACADPVTLDRWIDNVFGAKTSTDVFR